VLVIKLLVEHGRMPHCLENCSCCCFSSSWGLCF